MYNNPIRYFLLLLLLSAFGCKEEPPVVPPPPPPPPPIYKDTITLITEDVTHRSITVNIKTTANNPNSIIKFFRIFNSTETQVSEHPITVKDTSIIDDNFGNGLQLNTNYTYYAVRIDTTGERKDSSNKVDARTLAATNFNYSWQEFFIGDTGSVLYDVWGTDENNVYACGGVRLNDTSYGILKWNGVEWLPISKSGGYSIFGFSNSDIWVVGGAVWHYSGSVWEDYTFRDPVITNNISYYSLWGTSSSNLYFGSGGGKIIHWDGNTAEVVYSNPSNVYVQDLDGYSSDFIIGVGTGMIPPLLAVYYDGSNWANLPISSNWSLNSVSIVTKNHIYFGGDGIFEMNYNNFSQIFSSGFYIWDIEYNKKTGVTVASGAYDGVYIYNGLEWRNYQSQISSDETTYSGIFLINNTIFCVGRNDTQAKIIIGRN